jgi:hypothetical protein
MVFRASFFGSFFGQDNRKRKISNSKLVLEMLNLNLTADAEICDENWKYENLLFIRIIVTGYINFVGFWHQHAHKHLSINLEQNIQNY